MKKKILLTVVVLVAVALAFFGYRKIYCPVMLPMESMDFSAEERQMMNTVLDSNLISLETMANELQSKKVILAGEIHFEESVMQAFIEFLDLLPSQQFVLTLELPGSVQPDIDCYMSTGAQECIDKIKECGNCLPFTGIIEWCYQNKSKVKGVFAIDENRAQIVLNRALCCDTRNVTMTNRILEIQRNNSSIPVVFYGGQLHCLQSGRYLFDVENRTPVGSRLLDSFSRDELSTVIFTGNKRFVSYEAWGQRSGVLRINEQTRNLERRYFIHEPVKGAPECGEFFNYFVNVGDLN